jgi:hypothetical protein
LRLADGLKIGENHLRDLMDWLEEIALRDQLEIDAILLDERIIDIESNSRLGRADKLKSIKEEIRRLRFPRLIQIEAGIQARIQALKLNPQFRLTVRPGLEGGKLQVELAASSQVELKILTAQLADAAHQGAMQQIFDCLAGNVEMSGAKATK